MSTEMQTKVQASPAQNFTPVQTGLLQRKSALCNTPGLVEDSGRDEEGLTLQRSSVDRAGTTAVPRFGHDFSRVSVHSIKPGTIQTKLKINKPGDIYEQEADRVADAVMRMPEPGVQRQVEPEEEEEEMLQTKPLVDQITPLVQVQRQEEPEEEEEMLQAKPLAEEITPLVQRQVEPEEEEEELQAKATSGNISEVNPNFESHIQSLKGGGQPLSENDLTFFEPRFGADFSNVRVHDDTRAASSARSINARAFTLGHNIVFGAGEYSSSTSSGKRLLAHELTHVIHQSYRPSRIQRKIIVGGNPYTPTAKYYAYLDTNFGSHMKEFIKNMHNAGNPPDFTFTSYEQMGYEVRVRHQATKGIAAAHSGCCNYPDSTHPDHLDSTYWDRISWMRFKPKSPLPPGKEASDAIEAIFAPGAGTRLECLAMTVAVEYYSLLKGLGKTKFNVKFAGGAGLEISTRLGTGTHPTFYGTSRVYKNLTLSSKSEILPGDWVYFYNFADYLIKCPGGSWQGENAIYLGGGKYRGFGVSSLSEANMNKELVDEYNACLLPADHKTVADLLAAGRGLRLAPVFRPDIGKLVP